MKRNYLSSLLRNPLLTHSASLLLLLSVAKAQTLAPPVHLLDVVVNDADAKVFINGFPVLDMPTEGNVQQTNFFLSPFLKKGQNVIELRSTPQVAAGGAVKPSWLTALRVNKRTNADSEVDLPVFELEHTEDNEQTGLNSVFALSLEGVPAYRSTVAGTGKVHRTDLTLPAGEFLIRPAVEVHDTLHVDLAVEDAALDTLPWIGAEPVLEDLDRNTLRGMVAAVAAAVAERRYEDLALLFDAKYVRLATATGRAKADIIAEELPVLSSLTSTVGFTITPIDPAQLNFGVIAGVNLVRATLGGGPPIRGGSEDIEYSLDLYFSKIAGHWVLVE